MNGPLYESEPWNDIQITLKEGTSVVKALTETFLDDKWRELDGYGGPKCLARVVELARVPEGLRFTLRRTPLP